jgi:hypothetical protein
MRFYVSAKWEQKDLVQRIQQTLKRRKHTISEDWTKHRCVKPYDADEDTSAFYARADVNGVITCDVLIHLSDGGGKGKYGEFVGAIVANQLKKTPKDIYVIGRRANESQFYFHPAVERVQTTDVLSTVKELFYEGYGDEGKWKPFGTSSDGWKPF